MPQKKQIPKFKNEEEERAFWDAHDSTEIAIIAVEIIKTSM